MLSVHLKYKINFEINQTLPFHSFVILKRPSWLTCQNLEEKYQKKVDLF